MAIDGFIVNVRSMHSLYRLDKLSRRLVAYQLVVRSYIMMQSKIIEKELSEIKILQEMINTERTYNETLSLLGEAFSQEESVNGIPVLIDFKRLISILKNISDELITNVTRATTENLSADERNNLQMQRIQLFKAFFIAYEQASRLYNTYSENYHENKEQFEKLDQFAVMNNKSRFADLLVQPVQRGMRYALLVSEALNPKHQIPKGTLDKLNELKDVIKGLLEQANVSMNIQEPVRNSYQFITECLFGVFGNYNNNAETKVRTNQEPEETQRGYRFGDVSRAAYKKLFKSAKKSSLITALEELRKGNPIKLNEWAVGFATKADEEARQRYNIDSLEESERDQYTKIFIDKIRDHVNKSIGNINISIYEEAINDWNNPEHITACAPVQAALLELCADQKLGNRI